MWVKSSATLVFFVLSEILQIGITRNNLFAVVFVSFLFGLIKEIVKRLVAGVSFCSSRIAASSGGGFRPLWRSDGRELYFVAPGNRLMAASVNLAAGTPSVAPASTLFEVPLFGGLYAPAPDGKRFLIAMPAPSTDVVPMELRLYPIAAR